MRDLSAEFASAQKRVMTLRERPDNDTLLRLYALYKQGTRGDVHGDKPGFFDFVGTAKFEAWSKLRGVPPEQAQRMYIELVDQLLA